MSRLSPERAGRATYLFTQPLLLHVVSAGSRLVWPVQPTLAGTPQRAGRSSLRPPRALAAWTPLPVVAGDPAIPVTPVRSESLLSFTSTSDPAGSPGAAPPKYPPNATLSPPTLTAPSLVQSAPAPRRGDCGSLRQAFLPSLLSQRQTTIHPGATAILLKTSITRLSLCLKPSRSFPRHNEQNLKSC